MLGHGQILAQGPPTTLSSFVARSQKLSLEYQKRDTKDADFTPPATQAVADSVDVDDLHRQAGDASLYGRSIDSIDRKH